jgi:hypothetical protein
MTTRADSVSYACTGEDGKLQIHFHMDWLIQFVRRVGEQASHDVTVVGNLQDPLHWWANGDS